MASRSKSVKAQVLAIALAVLMSAPVAAQTQNSASDRAAAKQQQRVDRAKERCRLNHGVDCDTPEGLKEWLLQERSRQRSGLSARGRHSRAAAAREHPGQSYG
jgi:aminoglycoside phosphotransferase (APT) family kinase protein